MQAELQKFREQLVLAEVDSKRETQEQHENTNKKNPFEDPPHIEESQLENGTEISFPAKSNEENAITEGNLETDVFEIPLLAVPVETKIGMNHVPHEEDNEMKPFEECSELVAGPKKLVKSINLAQQEILQLKAKLTEKEKEIQSICAENDELKHRISETAAHVSVAQAREEETALKLTQMGGELQEIEYQAAQVTEELKAAVGAKLALEAEMEKLRVQTEQWKKAASAAASVLSGEVDMNGKRVAVQSSSLGLEFDGFEPTGYGGFDSLESGDFDDGLESGKRKGTGIRVFGDLWRKKGHK